MKSPVKVLVILGGVCMGLVLLLHVQKAKAPRGSCTICEDSPTLPLSFTGVSSLSFCSTLDLQEQGPWQNQCNSQLGADQPLGC